MALTRLHMERILQVAKETMQEYITSLNIPSLPDSISLTIYSTEDNIFLGGVIYQKPGTKPTASDITDVGYALHWASEVIAGDREPSEAIYKLETGLVLSVSFRYLLEVPSLQMKEGYRGLKSDIYAEILFKAEEIGEAEYKRLKSMK